MVLVNINTRHVYTGIRKKIRMASIGWEKVGRRWRVFWHVTLPDGTVDKGSKSFKEKDIAK